MSLLGSSTQPLDQFGVINKVREHFEETRQFAIEPTPDGCVTNRCLYRGDGDPKSEVRCAVGCLIPDELYELNRDWEGSAVSNELRDALVEAGVIDETVTTRWLQTLQTIHDTLAIEVLEGEVEADRAWHEFEARLGIVESLID